LATTRAPPKDFAWETSQMPNNVMDAQFRSFRNNVMPVCLKKRVGVIGMKASVGETVSCWVRGADLRGVPALLLQQPVTTQVVGMTSVEQLRENIASAATSSRCLQWRATAFWPG